MDAKRFIKRHSESGYFIVSAERECDTRKENLYNTNRLAKILQALDIQFKKVYGGYVMDESGIKTQEVSFVVFPYQYSKCRGLRFVQPEEFILLARTLGALFKQESVLVKERSVYDPFFYMIKENAYKRLAGDNIKYNDESQLYYIDFRKNTIGKLSNDKRATRFSF